MRFRPSLRNLGYFNNLGPHPSKLVILTIQKLLCCKWFNTQNFQVTASKSNKKKKKWVGFLPKQTLYTENIQICVIRMTDNNQNEGFYFKSRGPLLFTNSMNLSINHQIWLKVNSPNTFSHDNRASIWNIWFFFLILTVFTLKSNKIKKKSGTYQLQNVMVLIFFQPCLWHSRFVN